MKTEVRRPTTRLLRVLRDFGENAIVANCSADSQQMVRFAGVNTPAAGALSYIIGDSSAEN